MNRYLATSLLATMTGAALVFAAHGCAINPFAGYSYDEGLTVLAGASSSTSGGVGGAGGAGGTGGGASCTCTADDNECTDDVVGQCPGGEASACHTAVANRNCMMAGKAGYCDAAGACTACEECSDAACMKRCNGQVCQTKDVCVSGNCVDGYCCDSSCTGPCNACNRVKGQCVPLPAGMVGECGTGKLCGNTGSCKDTNKKPNGDLCASNADCDSGTCVAQICVSPNGQPCVEHLECASHICDLVTNTCVSCGGNVMCPAGASCLPGGQCQVFPGQPASNSNECVTPAAVHDNLTCTLPVGAACTNNFECIYHRCTGTPKSTCAGPCSIDAECPLGTTCNNMYGWCLLPPGSDCVIDDQCQGPMTTGTCAGFPRKCQ